MSFDLLATVCTAIALGAMIHVIVLAPVRSLPALVTAHRRDDDSPFIALAHRDRRRCADGGR